MTPFLVLLWNLVGAVFVVFYKEGRKLFGVKLIGPIRSVAPKKEVLRLKFFLVLKLAFET